MQIYHSKEEHTRFLLGSFHVDSSAGSDGSWKVFNLTKMLSSYLHLQENVNLEAYMKSRSRQQRSNENSCADISTDRVVLMVFTKDHKSTNDPGYPNLIQTVESSKYVKLSEMSEPSLKMHRISRNAKHSFINNNFPPRAMEHGKPLCRRVDMMVDFEKLGWGDVVIYPKKFNAYRCEGACPIPLSENLKPTNHAYLRVSVT